jgi:hypothetical protein
MNNPSDSSTDPGKRTRPVDSAASEFASETELPRSDPAKSARARMGTLKFRWISAVVAGGLIVSATVVIGLPKAGQADATLGVESDPVGAEVRVDGQMRGKTPLVLALAPGTYAVRVGTDDHAKERRVTLAAAERASIYHVLRTPREDVGETGPSAALSVITEPAGGRVTLDGVDRGAAPLVVPNLAGGEHRLVVRNQGTTYQQTVTLVDGSTSTVVVGATNAAAAAGWLSVQAPLRLQIQEAGRLLGTTETDRLMLPVGEHQLTFSDEQSGFRAARAVRIVAGDTANVALQIPRAPVNVNAIPWAEVWVDNERVGETPIGNYMLPLGSHQVELRHPQLGTKRMTMFVSLNGANRLAVNMRDR